MLKRSKMPRDPNQLAKMIVDMATGIRATVRMTGVAKNTVTKLLV